MGTHPPPDKDAMLCRALRTSRELRNMNTEAASLQRGLKQRNADKNLIREGIPTQYQASTPGGRGARS